MLGVPQTVATSPVDVDVAGGEELGFGGGARVMHVPGHSPGSIALYLPEHRVLFTGDTVAAADDGTVILGVFNHGDRRRRRYTTLKGRSEQGASSKLLDLASWRDGQ